MFAVSGQNPAITDFYPELPLYRDIVFLFKFMMTTESSAMPEVTPWMQTHAKLYWAYEAEGNLRAHSSIGIFFCM